MRLFGLNHRRAKAPAPEVRAASVAQSDQNFLEMIGLGAFGNVSDIVVTVEKALGVPFVSAAVNFYSGTIAGLPLHLYKRTDKGRERVTDTALAMMLHDAVNDQMSSFAWRKYTYDRVLTGGRGLTFIEKNANKDIVNFWPLNPTWVKIKRGADGRTSYHYSEPGRPTVVYAADEIIDIPFMLKPDGLGHMGPIMMNRDVIALAIAATEFGTKFFQNGGVPPFAVTGNFQSPGAMQRAGNDMLDAVRMATKDKRMALVLPSGLEIKPLGADAEKSQLVELKRFLIEEGARIFNLPPTFLQDLSHGTYSNTEQQDLHVTKHSVRRHVEAFEQELNLKLFGRGNRQMFVEFNMDGLLRGDFETRMQGYATAVQNGLMTPNEARAMENRADDPDGAMLMMQGATVPIRNLIGQANGSANDQPTNDAGESDGA